MYSQQVQQLYTRETTTVYSHSPTTRCCRYIFISLVRFEKDFGLGEGECSVMVDSNVDTGADQKRIAIVVKYHRRIEGNHTSCTRTTFAYPLFPSLSCALPRPSMQNKAKRKKGQYPRCVTRSSSTVLMQLDGKFDCTTMAK